MEIDLTPYMGYHTHPEFTRVANVLGTPNKKVPASDENGFFCRNSSDIASGKQLQKEFSLLCVSIKDKFPGLVDLEESQTAKCSYASGHLPFSYLKESGYGLILDKEEVPINDILISELSLIFKHVSATRTPLSKDLSLYGPTRSFSEGVPIAYKLHSNYGAIRSIAGKDKRNQLSLLFHYYLADTTLRRLIHEPGGDITLLCRDVLANINGSAGTFAHPHAAMLIKRVKLANEHEPRPLWQPVRHNNSIKLVSDAASLYSESSLRKITACPAFLNLPLNPMVVGLSTIMQNITGLHVGHILINSVPIIMAQNAWGADNVILLPEDITAYDDSTHIGMIRAYEKFMQRTFSLNDVDMKWLDLFNHIPLLTTGFGTKGFAEYNTLRRVGGIPSGSQDTTAKGTILNLLMCAQTVLRHTNIPEKDVFKRCLNFCSVVGSRERDCIWGFMIKGDDLIFIARKGHITAEAIINGRRSLGYETRIEPAPIFLQNYIDERFVKQNADFIASPPAFKSGRSLLSTGLIQRRLKNRFQSAEDPPDHELPARFGMLANLIDIQWHPLAADGRRMLLSILNKYDSNNGKGWSFSSLQTYCNSTVGITAMKEYAIEKGLDDRFVKELITRTMSDRGVNGAKDDELTLLGRVISKELITTYTSEVNVDGITPDNYETMIAPSSLIASLKRGRYDSIKQYSTDNKKIGSQVEILKQLAKTLE